MDGLMASQLKTDLIILIIVVYYSLAHVSYTIISIHQQSNTSLSLATVTVVAIADWKPLETTFIA